MRTAKRPSLILDRHGKPAAYYEASRNRYSGDRSWLNVGNVASDSWTELDNSTLQSLQASGRFLFKNVPIVRGAILEKASMSFPLEPQYNGSDKEWGDLAEAALHDWHKVMCVAGPAYDFDTLGRMILISAMVDGDIGTLLRKTRDNFPQVQIIRAHRIGDREFGLNSKFKSGVQLSSDGRPIAYQILGAEKADDVVVSANDFELTFRPDAPDQSRGVSALCASIGSFADVKRLREYEMRAQQLFASMALIENNETGEADTAAEAITMPSADGSGTPSGLVTQSFEAGMIKYYRSNSGSGLEAFRSDRPSADAQAFEDKIISGALYGIEWDPNFALAIKEPGGAYARTVIEKIRRSISNGQKLVKKWARRIDGWALSVMMKNGVLPYPKTGDWYSWDYQCPARITADTGNEKNARREDYKLGLLTMEEEQAESGKWWEETREQRQREVEDLLTRAQSISSTYGISINDALNLLEQRSPNPMSTPAQPAIP